MNEVRAIVEAFDASILRGERCALATLVSVDGSSYRRPGARMLVSETGASTGTISAGCLEADIVEHAKAVIARSATKLVEYNTAAATEEEAWSLGLGCNGVVRVLIEPVDAASVHLDNLRRSLEAPVFLSVAYAGGVFTETLLPPVPLVVFGAGQDVVPVVELAHRLGWHTEVVDPSARLASRSRFPLAGKVILTRPEQVAAHVRLTQRTMALLMSHNYSHDLALLKFVLDSPAAYIGVMGPRHRTERMLRELGAADDPERLHAPVGLDIGANSPAEIAVSIIAEIRAVLDGRSGGMLRDRDGGIHQEGDEPAKSEVAA